MIIGGWGSQEDYSCENECFDAWYTGAHVRHSALADVEGAVELVQVCPGF